MGFTVQVLWFTVQCLQGYLANMTIFTPLGPPPLDPKHRPTVGSQGKALSYERGTPVGLRVEDSVFRDKKGQGSRGQDLRV